MKFRSILVLAVLLLLAMEPAMHVHPMGDGKAPCPACNWGQMLAIVADVPRVEPLLVTAEVVVSPSPAVSRLASPAAPSRAPPAA